MLCTLTLILSLLIHGSEYAGVEREVHTCQVSRIFRDHPGIEANIPDPGLHADFPGIEANLPGSRILRKTPTFHTGMASCAGIFCRTALHSLVPRPFFCGGGKKRPGHHCSRMRGIFRKISVKYSVSRTAKYTMHVSK